MATTMTKQYRDEQLAIARDEATKAREAYDVAKGRKARISAGEDLDFWTNKAAFFANVNLDSE